ncbi:MAG: hypothetical protein HC841_07140 [Verrucomicrobiae bacterium]|nr:hypothetical protein [Verrucomicrobiae bacterium]
MKHPVLWVVLAVTAYVLVQLLDLEQKVLGNRYSVMLFHALLGTAERLGNLIIY